MGLLHDDVLSFHEVHAVAKVLVRLEVWVVVLLIDDEELRLSSTVHLGYSLDISSPCLAGSRFTLLLGLDGDATRERVLGCFSDSLLMVEDRSESLVGCNLGELLLSRSSFLKRCLTLSV